MTSSRTDYNTKTTEIKDKISSITGLATTAALNTAEKKYLALII